VDAAEKSCATGLRTRLRLSQPRSGRIATAEAGRGWMKDALE